MTPIVDSGLVQTLDVRMPLSGPFMAKIGEVKRHIRFADVRRNDQVRGRAPFAFWSYGPGGPAML